MSMNRIHNSTNPLQGGYKKILCVCSAGLLRSPTAAWVLGQEPYYHNTRAAGLTDDFALIKVDTALLSWADEVVVMEDWMAAEVKSRGDNKVLGFHSKNIYVLDIPDNFYYRDQELVRLIKVAYDKLVGLDSLAEKALKLNPIETHDE